MAEGSGGKRGSNGHIGVGLERGEGDLLTDCLLTPTGQPQMGLGICPHNIFKKANCWKICVVLKTKSKHCHNRFLGFVFVLPITIHYPMFA